MSDRKILITNDDGIYAGGLVCLVKTAVQFGEVWVIAPDKQRSGTSHSVILHHNIEVWKVDDFPVEGVKAYACDGNPADCVRIGTRNIIPNGPDFVFSGINFGYNAATDLQYSATAAGAFEGAFQNAQAIAFSEEAVEEHEVTEHYLGEVMAELMDKPLNTNQIWNVNFPGGKLVDCKGILRDRKVSLKYFYDDNYTETPISENRTAYMVNGTRMFEAEEGTDLRALLDGYVSVGIATNIS